MFYSQDILQKRGGKFGVVWIAATRAISLTRREYFSVNVAKTCEDILTYITLRAEPMRRGESRPRLSLYLSSQLMYGVVRIYDKQQDYLRMDATNLSIRFASLKEFEIDLHSMPRYDAITLRELVPLRPDLDIDYLDFGSLRSPTRLPELSEIPTIEFHSFDEARGDITFPETPKTPKIPFRPELASPMQSPKEKITLTEPHMSPLMDIEIPGEKDLPELEQTDISKIMGATTQKELEAYLSPIAPTLPSTESGQEILAETDIDEVLPPAEKTPSLRPDAERALRPQRREVTPGVTPGPDTEGEPPKKKKKTLPLELSAVTPSRVNQRRKRLILTDRELQISKESLRKNLLTGKNTCRKFELPSLTGQTATELFNLPGKKEFHHPKLLPLWKRNTTTMGFYERKVDLQSGVWCVPELRETSSSDGTSSPKMSSPSSSRLAMPLEPDLSSVLEVARQSRDTEGSMEIAVASKSSILEKSRSQIGGLTPRGSLAESREASLANESDLRPSSRSRRGHAGVGSFELSSASEHEMEMAVEPEQTVLATVLEEQEEAPPVPVLMPAMEVVQDLDVAKDLVQKSSEEHELISELNRLTASRLVVTFKELCPLHTSRRSATHKFAFLLELGKKQQVKLSQETPYQDIYISRGRNW